MVTLGLLAAFVMGLTLGLLGGGGSILTVPILIYLFKFDAESATTASLLVVGVTALLAAAPYVRRREMALKAGIQFAGSSFLGIVLARKILLPALPEVVISVGSFSVTRAEVVLIAFAVLMIAAAFVMIKGSTAAVTQNSPSLLRTVVQGGLVGLVTGFVGAGGGFIIVPALVRLLGLRMRIAVGTSLLIIAANSIFGFLISDFQFLGARWPLLAAVLSLATVGSVVGGRFAAFIDEKKSKITFGYFVLVMGSFILIERVFSR